VPVLPEAGVTVTVRFAPLPPNTIFAFGTSVVADELPETVRFAAAVSPSPTVKANGPVDCPAVTDWLEIVEIVGAVFGAFTVKEKLVLVVLVPSLTDTVICEVPVLPDVGVTVTVRLFPAPPKTIFAFGTSDVTEDVPETVKFTAAVSASVTVNAIGPVDCPDVTVCAPIIEMFGGVLAAPA